ncbi:NusG domain II-containing protein [Roseburia sp. AF42-8]|uniref:NusG domain II-containing protein n=1 Tax=Roseburia sp. AF42-8 TaxID=2293137 RepID=UPI001FA8BF8B|nr:NusG domain II-containing protein [Roseburia sp. AF42-8]
MNRRFGKNDILLLGILAVVILVFYVGMTSALRSGDSIIITVNGSEYGRYSLSENKEIPIKIDGKVTNIVTIENGTAICLRRTARISCVCIRTQFPKIKNPLSVCQTGL